MKTRLRQWSWQMLLSFDQTVGVWLFGWFYVWLNVGDCPKADETISSRVGRHAVAGATWALKLEVVINWLAFRLGDVPDHCRKNIGT